jgi:hypothetical protein
MNNNNNVIYNDILQFNLLNNIIIPTKFTKHKIEKKNNCVIIKKIFQK